MQRRDQRKVERDLYYCQRYMYCNKGNHLKVRGGGEVGVCVKQKRGDERSVRDWSGDVCSCDLY